MASKRKAEELDARGEQDAVDPADELLFVALGGGSEVPIRNRP